MTDRALLAQIAASPDEVGPYLILADALQQAGDPRGDLIAVQHALETAPVAQAAELRRREAELLETHAKDWLGPLWDHRTQVVVRWRRGFVNAARVVWTDHSRPDMLTALLGVPHIEATLAELRLGPSAIVSFCPALEPLIVALGENWPGALRRLYLGDGELRGLHDALFLELRDLLRHAGALELLFVQGSAVRLGWPAAPARLRRLEWRVPRSLDEIHAIAAWPALEELTVWTERPDPLTWLTVDRFPRLRRLGLVGAAGSDAFSRELATLPIVARLERLELSGGTLTAPGTIMLRPLASRLELDLRRNLLATTACRALVEDGIDIAPQRRGKRSLIAAGELAMLHTKFTAAARDFGARAAAGGYAEPAGALRRYRGVAKLAELGDPRWEQVARPALVRHLAEPDADQLRRELVEILEAEVGALWLTHGARLCAEIGRRASTSNELFEAECWLWRAVIEARWLGLDAVETDALANVASVRMRRGDPHTAAPLLERVAERYRSPYGERSQLAWTLRMQGNVELVRSAFPAAEAFYNEALALYRAAKDATNEAIVLGELAGTLWMRQDFAGAEKLIRQSIAMRELDSLSAGSAHRNLGALLSTLGRIDEAIEAAEHSLAVFRKHAHRGGEGQALSLLGELHQRCNEHDRARELLEQALACDRETGAVREEGVTLGNLSRVALDLGDWDGARAYCELALDCHRQVGNRYNEGMQLLGIADAAIGERRYDEALVRAGEAMVPLQSIANLPAIAAVRMRFGFVAQLRRELDKAERHYHQSIDDATRGRYPELVGWNELWLGVLFAQRKKPREAYGFLGRATGELGKRARSRETLAMASAVIARFGGDRVPLPVPRSWDARVLASLLD